MLCTHLRRIYNLCNENSQLQGMEYTHIEGLIPFKGEWDMKSDEKKTSEVYRHVCEERNQLIEVNNLFFIINSYVFKLLALNKKLLINDFFIISAINYKKSSPEGNY